MDVHSSLIRGVRVSHLPGIALKAIHTSFGEINLSLSLVDDDPVEDVLDLRVASSFPIA
jgi:hypothetical protein